MVWLKLLRTALQFASRVEEHRLLF